MTNKLCSKCGENERASSAHWCNPCRNEYNRKHHHRNRKKVNRRRREWKKKIRAKVISHYGGCCECCGETEPYFLGIDHIGGGGNKHRKKVNGSIYLWLRQHEYPEGFRVLCHNCNLAIGFYGTCPHQLK